MSTITALSSFTEGAPLSPSYLNGKFSEVNANLQTLSGLAASSTSMLGWVNVASYGAVGDWNGTTGTDNWRSFQSAFDDASKLGTIVLIPPGQYYYTGTLEANPSATHSYATYGGRIRVIGANSSFTFNAVNNDKTGTILIHGGGGVPAIQSVNTTGSSASDIRLFELEHFTLVGASDTSALIFIQGATEDCAMRHLYLKSRGTNCHGVYMLDSWGHVIENVTARGPSVGDGTVTGKGILLFNQTGGGTLNQTILRNCNIGYFGDNLSIGTINSASGAAVTVPVLVEGGQCTHGDGRGVTVGYDVRGVTFLCHHSEGNNREGYLFTTSGGGIQMLDCSTNANGSDGSSYDISFGGTTGKCLGATVDGLTMTLVNNGIHVAVGTGMGTVRLDNLRISAGTNGAGSAISIENASDNTQQIILGSNISYKYQTAKAFLTELTDPAQMARRPVHDRRFLTMTSGGTINADGLRIVRLQFASLDTVSGITGGYEGQSLFITSSNANAQIVGSGNTIKLWQSSDYSVAASGRGILHLVKNQGNWDEVGHIDEGFKTGLAVSPGIKFASEESLGFFRSAASTIAQSYGTFRAPEIWATSSGISALGQTVSASRISSTATVIGAGVWTSGLSVGNATAGGTLIPAISSTSTKIAAFVVQPSASSFTVVTWAAAQPGDQIMVTIMPDAAVSSLSSGLVLHSHCTQAGQVEVRLSNVSTLAQNQSSKTYYLTRMSPF